MASLTVHLDADGIEETTAALDAMGRRAVDARPVWREFARFLMRAEMVRFQGGAFHWAPLDEDTIRQKGNARILRASGVLEDALTKLGAPGQKLKTGRQSMTFGLQPNGVAYYGVFHQEGRSVPVREPLVLPWNAGRRASDLLLDHVMGRL